MRGLTISRASVSNCDLFVVCIDGVECNVNRGASIRDSVRKREEKEKK